MSNLYKAAKDVANMFPLNIDGYKGPPGILADQKVTWSSKESRNRIHALRKALQEIETEIPCGAEIVGQDDASDYVYTCVHCLKEFFRPVAHICQHGWKQNGLEFNNRKKENSQEMNIDLIIVSPPTNTYRLYVKSNNDIMLQIQTNYLKDVKDVLQRLRLLLRYRDEVAKREVFFISKRSIIEFLDRICYEQKLNFQTLLFWEAMIGYRHQSNSYFSYPVEFWVTYFDGYGVEKNVGIVVDGKSIGEKVVIRK